MDFNTILSDTLDITEPASYEKILFSLDAIELEDEDFMQLLTSKVDGMVITWDQPWYQHSNCLTRPFKENHDNLEKFRTDHICKKENDHMLKKWKKFIKKFDVPDKLLSFARWRNKKKCKSPNTPEETVRRFVTAYLAKGLERNLYQVYKYIVTQLGNPVKGPYTPVEEKVMEICFYHNPIDAVTNLSLLLSREPRGIYKKLQQTYTGKPDRKRLKWTIELASKFVNLLIQHTGCSIEELKYKQFEKSLWLIMEKEMGQQYSYLQKFWYDALHVQIFVKQDIKYNTTRRKILQILQNSHYEIWRDIQWKDLLKFFPDGITHKFLYKLFSNLVKKNKTYLKQPLSEVLEEFLQRVKRSRSNKRLKTFIYENGVLRITRYKKLKRI